MKTVDQDMVSGIGLIVFGITGFIGASRLENLVVADLSAAFFPNIFIWNSDFLWYLLTLSIQQTCEKGQTAYV